MREIDFITIQEASKIAGFTEGYLRRMLINDGFKDMKRNIDYEKFGKVWMIKKSSWTEHLERQKNKSMKIEEEI